MKIMNIINPSPLAPCIYINWKMINISIITHTFTIISNILNNNYYTKTPHQHQQFLQISLKPLMAIIIIQYLQLHLQKLQIILHLNQA